MAQPQNLEVQSDHSPYSSHSGSSSMSSFGRHVFAQEVGGGSFQDKTPPPSHGGQPMAHSQTTRLPTGSPSIKYPPSMMHPNRTAPLETTAANGNMLISVEQIVSKLDTASEENMRLRNALQANNQLLDQKLRQFEPLVQENQKLKLERDQLQRDNDEMLKTRSEATNKFFEARVAVMGFKCRTMQLQGELEEMKKVKAPDVGRLQQQVDQLLRDKRTLEERNRALSARAQPGGMDQTVVQLERQVAELNRSVYTLQNDKSSYETILYQLQQDVRSVQDKKQLEEEEKNRALNEAGKLRNELERIQRDNQALLRQLEQVRNNTPQDSHLLSQKAHFEGENLNLQARCQELNEHIVKLQGELATQRRLNEQLHGKVHELDEAKTALRSKLESYTGSQEQHPPRPTPTPRTSLQPTVNALQAEKERLEAEKKDLQDKLEVAVRSRTTAEEQFRQSSSKAQAILQEKCQLGKQLEEKESRITEQHRALISAQEEVQRLRTQNHEILSSGRGEGDRLRESVTELRREREELRGKVASLEKVNAQKSTAASSMERQELEYRGKIARLEEQLKQMQLETPVTAALESIKTRQAPLAKRLNDALGRIKELETLNKGLEDSQARAQVEYKSLQEVHDVLKNRVEVEQETQRKAAESRSDQLQKEVTELRAEQSRLCEDKHKLQRNLEHAQGDLERKVREERQLTEQLHSFERQVTEKTEALEQMRRSYDEVRSQLDSAQLDKEKKSGKLTELQRQYTDARNKLKEISSERESLQTTVHQLEGEKVQLSELKRKIEGEKSQLDKTVKEYRTESESILNDYTQAMADLRATKEDRDNLQQMYTRCNQELNQQRERSRLLEIQRKEVQDKLSHMDEQLKLYHEDFERERHAREAAIKVKNLAEERMKKMERDMKELRDRLNQHAARRLREDQYDDHQSPSEYRKSGEHRFSGSQSTNLTEPNKFVGSRPHSGQQEQPGGHQHSGPQYTMPNVHESTGIPSPGIPPIPPKGIHHGTPPAASGFGGGMGGAGGGAIGGGSSHVTPPRGLEHSNVPPHGGSWTQYQPPSHYPSATPPRVVHPSTMMVTGHPNPSLSTGLPQDGAPPLRANIPPGGHVSGFPGPSSSVNQTGGLNRYDLPGQTSIAGHAGAVSAQPSMLRTGGGGVGMIAAGLGGTPPNQLNDLNQLQGVDKYVAPGEVINEAPPSMACPLCGKSDFKTQTDLELHCAQCV